MSHSLRTAPEESMDRPLRMAFVITSLPVGGAEMLLLNLVRRLPAHGVDPMVCCLKKRGPLGAPMSAAAPLVDRLLRHKYDVRVLGRLRDVFRDRRIDVLVTVGSGDKMFWGRLAARWAGVPVVLSALHSTGWPDGVGRLNRWLTPWTDGFIGVARQHARFLIEREGFPAERVFVIPNGIDIDRFQYAASARQAWRDKLSIPADAPVLGIVAALRAEKNHEMFLEVAHRVVARVPQARFLIVGDGPQRPLIERRREELNLRDRVLLTGSTDEIPGVLSAMDVFALTSHNEASPVSIMEALSCQRPVVATDVGSVSELIRPGMTGYLAPPGEASVFADAVVALMRDADRRAALGAAGRELIAGDHSLEAMAAGYAALSRRLWIAKPSRRASRARTGFHLGNGWRWLGSKGAVSPPRR